MKRQNLQQNLWALVTSLFFCFLLCASTTAEPPVTDESTAIVLENGSVGKSELEATPTAEPQNDDDLKKGDKDEV